MHKFSKLKIVFITLIASAPVVLFFQNCGQAGSVTASSVAAVNSKGVSESLIITQPVVSSNNQDQIVSIDKPPLSINENGEISSSDNSNVDSGAKGSIAECGQINISDILLKISSVSINCDKPTDVGMQIIDSDKSISLDKLNLKLKALKNEKVSELFLLLNADGNKVLTLDNVVLDLKSPSAQQSGLKVKLTEDISLVAGQSYNLELVINPSEQIVTNKNKCIFKPFVKEATLKVL